ncbi:TAP42 family protein [Cardiosporidium cionae]|uniref:TAP42 family protein n=1 Tax=Cardiosporidium cionae TaxID=476202 RepID=A0ABQ7J7Q9_9APIC|nr:TAP42 family protein [Cardiosporidium cionae]|eukprot:KAF8819974.1 TAP42 family protein [Cardiosporidium cionae]
MTSVPFNPLHSWAFMRFNRWIKATTPKINKSYCMAYKVPAIYFQQYLCVAEKLRVGREIDFDSWQRDTPPDATMLRAERIERVRYEKELTRKIQQYLQRNKRSSDNEWETGKWEDEETERSFYLVLLERFVTDALKQLNLVIQEIPLLELKLQADSAEVTPEATNFGALSHPSIQLDSFQERHTKPWIYRLRNSAESRELYKQLVFRPGHKLPSITLAACGEMEMELERQRRNANSEKSQKNYAENSEGQEEKDAREWDDWKITNTLPTGRKSSWDG